MTGIMGKILLIVECIFSFWLFTNIDVQAKEKEVVKVITTCLKFNIKEYGKNNKKSESCIPARLRLELEDKRKDSDQIKNFCSALLPKEQEEVMRSMVWIVSENLRRNDLPEKRGGSGEIVEIIKDEKLRVKVLTAPHVIGDDSDDLKKAKIKVRFFEGSEFEAKVITDSNSNTTSVNWLYEMILLEVVTDRNEELEKNIKDLKISADEAKQWDDVILAGFPNEINVVKTGDLVLLADLLFPIQLADGSLFQVKKIIGIDSSGLLSGGISGGAVLNCKKELVGVVWGGFENAAFILATPFNDESRKLMNKWLLKK